ncbi:hypothetical protein [Armatimonas sp.]|uniref:hypothetical protein n=1 Tax=Armatimonas sp. TaxID=1872638 RepID=UPI00286A48BF|nr:hypothetical protein [Armatimonas sp.]
MKRWLILIFPLLGLIPAFANFQKAGDSPDTMTQYLSASVDDPIARLQKKLDAGSVKLAWGRHGYLDSVLKELQISPRTQTLVFSKTSLQIERISPKTPRALYFNDACYIAWCQEGVMVEAAVQDPTWGTIFYTLPQRPTEKPKFVRQKYECLQCHSSPMTENIPGLAIRSVYPMADGYPDLSEGTFLTSDHSPIKERWGGWYVSGRHGTMRHMGNVIARHYDNVIELDREKGANNLDLSRYFDTKPYLTPHSDIAALMVLEHQSHLHNLMTKVTFRIKDALRDEVQLNETPNDHRHNESTIRRIESACEPLVQALLFSGATELSAPVSGTAGFEAQFSARGPKDKHGRSLYQLDLTKRLLRYPCSYLIYSESFDGLPVEARQQLARRLTDILRGKDQSTAFSHLSATDRQAVQEILQETKPGFLPASH